MRTVHAQSASMTAAAIFAVEKLEGRQLLSAGQLDPTFGNGGALVDFSLPTPASIAVQSDGKVVEFGTILNNFSVARFNSDGTPDNSFGFQGRLITDLGSTEVASKVLIQPDGKIVVVGLSNGNIAIVRYQANGQLDNSFGIGGNDIAFTGLPENIVGISYIPGGKVLVLAQSSQPSNGSTFGSDEMVRFLPNGTLDSTFGLNSKIERDHQAILKSFTTAVGQADGKLVAIGTIGDAMEHSTFRVRYNIDGSTDTTFAGIVPGGTDSQGGTIAVGADGKIVSSEADGTHRLILRYKSDGTFDSTFGGAGSITETGQSGNTSPYTSLVEQADGKVVAAGDGFIHRYNSNGSVDNTFGSSGKTVGKGVLTAGPSGTIYAIPGGLFNILEIDRYTGDAAIVIPPAGTPFLGTPAPIPGRIEAENFDNGGEGSGYHTVNPINYTNNLYRVSGVSVENSTDTGGGYNVGYLHAGEYLNYSVNVAAAGTYDLSTRVADAGVGAAFHIEIDGTNVTGNMVVPSTGGYQTYQTLIKTGIPLTVGQHVVRLVLDANNPFGFAGNFNWLQFDASGGANPNPGGSSISGTVYNDSSNSNSALDAGEPGIAGRQVYLDIGGFGTFKPGDPLAVTDANGLYQFTGLAAGNYLVRMMPFAGTGIDDPVFGGSHFITLGANAVSAGQNFGVIPLGGANGAVAFQPDGKIIAAVRIKKTNANDVVGLRRFNTDGSIDTTFGNGGGLLILDNLQFSVVKNLGVLPNGNIVVALDHLGFGYFTLVGSNGIQILSQFYNGLVSDKLFVQSDNKTLVAFDTFFQGNTNTTRFITRYNLDTSPDLSFNGGNPIQIPGVDGLTLIDLVQLANGNVQTTYTNGNINFIRTFSPTGVLL